MRERGVSNLTTVLLAGLAALLVAPFFMSWAVVDVRTAPPDDVRIKLPVPLAALRIALAAIPADEMPAELPEDIGRHREQAIALVRELDSAPDATFLTVSAPDTRVRLAKEDGLLLLEVDDHDTHVRARLPIAAAREALEEWDWRTFDARIALDVLAECRGPLVDVEAPDARVKIAMW